jgi:cytochrome P450
VLIDLTDAKPFARNEFDETMRWLRANDPVHWHAEPGGPGFWAVTRHADAVGVYRDTETFSSRFGMRLEANPLAVSAVSQRMLIVTDPPDHSQLKRVLSKALGPDELAAIGVLAREVVKDLLTEAVAAGEVNMAEVARRLPTRVVCGLMGVPREEWDWLGGTMNMAFEGEDEEIRRGSHAEIFLYFTELLDTRRREPGDDFVSRIATDTRATSSGESRPLTDEEIIVNCNGVLAGGNETTRYSAAGAVLAFIEHPDQWAALREGGHEVIATAVEEVLRWTTPGVHVMRTAMKPAVVGGVDVAEGERVTLWNVSANRDEDAFPDPYRFDITRTPNRHVTFGDGRHLCLGSRLARMELAIFLEELVRQVESFEPAGTVEYTESNFTWGARSLPVRLRPRSV